MAKDYSKESMDSDMQLFRPYYIGYQDWRDNALKTAQQLLDSKKNATIVSLDIKRYFYSVNIDVDDLWKKCKDEIGAKDEKGEKYGKYEETTLINKLNNALNAINKKYTDLAKPYLLDLNIVNSTILPVGLVSSGFIGNLYLSEFDTAVCKKIKPEYYGRYVDDMLFVFRNIEMREDPLKLIDEIFVKKTGLLECTEDKGSTSFEINKDLSRRVSTFIIQPSKIIVEHFSYKESRAAINNFINNVEKQRSEFRFLPDEEDVNKEFDNEAYTLQYSDSINKLRSIRDFKEDKYGASKYLAKKIFLSCFTTGDSADNDIITKKQILSFFKGHTTIDFYTLWEKVASYFIVKNDTSSLYGFYDNVKKAIKDLQSSNNNIKTRLQEDLSDYLTISLATPCAMNLDFSFEKKLKDDLSGEINEFAKKIRQANMFKHQMVGLTAINYTKKLHDSNINLFETDIQKLKGLEMDMQYPDFSPRFIRFDECCIMSLYCQLQKNAQKLSDFNKCEYLDNAFEFYWSVNYSWRYSNGTDNSKKEIIKNKLFCNRPINCNSGINSVLGDCYIKIPNNNSSVKKDLIRVAIANMKVDSNIIYNDTINSPNLSIERRRQLFSIINDAASNKADILVLPELSVPYQWMDLLAHQSTKHNLCIIAGITYLYNQEKYAFNNVTAFLPVKDFSYQSCVVLSRIKNHYSPEERKMLENYRYRVPNIEKLYHLIHWRNVYFSVYNCFELASIEDRAIFKSKVDFIVATELNKDTNYYSDIAGSWTRDMHCYFIQVNTSNYGDSRIMKPSKSEDKNMVVVKGGINAATLVDDINVKALRDFQLKGYGLQEDDKQFKKTPPNFSIDNVMKRIKNEDFD